MMSRNLGLGFAFVGLLLVAGVLGVVSLVRSGFSAHDEPSALEAFVAGRMRSWAVPASLKNATNPLPRNAAIIDEGLAHWADHCALCHGNDGSGTEMGRSMYPPVPDMTSERVQKLSDGEMFSIIENGIRLTGMPGFGTGTAGSAYGSWALVHFIRHLPNVSGEEILRMELLNPKSPAEWQQMDEEAAFLAGEDDGGGSIPHHATPHQH